MSTDSPDASAAPSEPPESGEETSPRPPSARIDEGLGVFRGLILMLIFYAASALLVWAGWQAWRHWHTH